MTLYITLAVVVALIAAAIRIRFWHKFWSAEGRKLQHSGYLPPAPSWVARLAFRLINRLIVWLAIGPVKVIGRENLRGFKGRLMVTPNHTQAPDWALVEQGVHYERYTAVCSELKDPARAIFSAWSGCFGVDKKQEGGADAFRHSCESVLLSKPNVSLNYFPQGKLVPDNILRKEDFAYGAVRILKSVQRQLPNGEKVYFLPVAILYVDDRAQATWFHRLMVRFGLKWFRNMFGAKNVRAVEVIGKPIAADQLPEDADPEKPANGTEFIHQRIQELMDIAVKN